MSQYKELINKSLILLEKIKVNILNMIESNELDHEFDGHINRLTDLFLNIANFIKQYDIKDDELAVLIEDISNDLVSMIQFFNGNKLSKGIDLLLNQIFSKFDTLSVSLDKKVKYRLIIYGVNEISIKLGELINYDNCEFVCYISNDSNYWYKSINGVPIVPLSEVTGYAYDYLLIADTDIEAINNKLINKEINNDQLFNYIHYIYSFGFYASPEFFIQYNNFMRNSKEYEGIITGISYIQKGINTDFLSKNFFNFAGPSQDLFYDYEIMKFALNFMEVKKTIKYAIIGLCYYSFQYDLSQSIHSGRSNYYYKITKKYHNYRLAEEGKRFLKRFNEVSEKILISNHDKVFIENQEEQYQEIINNGKKVKFDSSMLCQTEIENYIDEVKRKFNKDYPMTVEENKVILDKYLDLLYSCNIKPIIVVPPQTKLYRANISEHIRDEFYGIINEFQKKYEFQFIDYFYSDFFDDSDFYDVSHLNNKGSEKWTKLLNKDIWG